MRFKIETGLVEIILVFPPIWCGICLKLTIKTPERCHISDLFLVPVLLTLNVFRAVRKLAPIYLLSFSEVIEIEH